MTALRPRHEAFAIRRVIDAESAGASYRAIYPRSKPASSFAAASRLLHFGNVARRIEELRQAAAKRREAKIDVIAAELHDAHEMAMRLGQASAAVSASMALARLFGLIISRSERIEYDKTSGDPLTMLIDEMGSEHAVLRALDAMREELVKRIDANRD